MKRIRIAQIGTSRYGHGNQIFQSIADQKDVFEIAGYAMPEGEKDKFPEEARLFRPYRELDVEEILGDPQIEAVTVETEEKHLAKYGLLAARAGKHVHMEKPGGTELAPFREAVLAASERGKVFHMGYMFRYNPFVAKAVEEARNGDFGAITGIEAKMGCLQEPEMRRWLADYPGGAMYFLGCHLVDIILSIKGIPQKTTPFSNESGMDGIMAKDHCMAVFEYPGALAFARTDMNETGGFSLRSLSVSGTKKSLEIKPLEKFEEGGLSSLKREYLPAPWGDGGAESKSAVFGRYGPMLLAFAEMVRGLRANPRTPQYEIALFETILAASGLKAR